MTAARLAALTSAAAAAAALALLLHRRHGGTWLRHLLGYLKFSNAALRCVEAEEADDTVMHASDSSSSSLHPLQLNSETGECSFDGVVRPRSTTVFELRVPPRRVVAVTTTTVSGGDVQLHWRAHAAPQPAIGAFDGRQLEPPLELRWREGDDLADGAENASGSVLYVSVRNPQRWRSSRCHVHAALEGGDSRRDESVAAPPPGAAVAASAAAGPPPPRPHLSSLRPAAQAVIASRRMRPAPPLDAGKPRPPSYRLLEARAHSYVPSTAEDDDDACVRRSPWAPNAEEWHRLKAEAAACRRECRLWRDPNFEHAPASLAREAGSLAEPSAELSDGSGRPGALDAVRWLNLRELYGAPHRWPGGRASHLYAYEHHAVELHDEAAQMGQVVQGGVGNCYFLSAVAAAMGDLDVRRDMIDESLEEAGIYGVSFFLRGRWRMVWVDSYFPCGPSPPRRAQSLEAVGGGEGGAGGGWWPLYAHSTGEREAWLMVVEKAFAKLHGCYEALDKGHVACALAYITGGVAETDLLHAPPGRPLSEAPCADADELWRRLNSGLAGGASGSTFMGAGTPLELDEDPADSFPLVAGHAYAVVGIHETGSGGSSDQLLDGGGGGTVRYVRLRNPWGHGDTTPGDGHAHALAALASPARSGRRRAFNGHQGGALALDGGELWLTLSEFRRRFALLYFCEVLATTLNAASGWHRTLLANEWAGPRAGGCPNAGPSFARNPQFAVRLLRPTRLTLVLAQYHEGDAGRARRDVDHAIGLVVLACGGGRAAAPLRRRQVVGTSKYVHARQVTLRLELPMSDDAYTVVGSTFSAGELASFMVYVYADQPVEVLGAGGAALADDGWVTDDGDANGAAEGQLIVLSARSKDRRHLVDKRASGRRSSTSAAVPADARPPLVARLSTPKAVPAPPPFIAQFTRTFLNRRHVSSASLRDSPRDGTPRDTGTPRDGSTDDGGESEYSRRRSSVPGLVGTRVRSIDEEDTQEGN